MASELQFDYLTGATLYAQVANGVGAVWNGTAFVTPAQADWEDYAVTLTEVMPTHYQGDLPAVAAGRYGVRVYRQGGASPSSADGPAVGVGEIDWGGSAALLPLTEAQVLAQVTAALNTADVATEQTLVALPATLLDTALGAHDPGTVGEALVAARAQGYGRWVIDEEANTLTLYDTDDTTALRVFDLAPAGGPYTSRTPQ